MYIIVETPLKHHSIQLDSMLNLVLLTRQVQARPRKYLTWLGTSRHVVDFGVVQSIHI